MRRWNNNKKKWPVLSPFTVGRDLLHLALVLALLHVNPEAYLGNNNYYEQQHKVLDDLNSLGRYSSRFISPEPVEISAYVLNTEDKTNNDPVVVQEDDSGVSDVDCQSDSSDNDAARLSSDDLDDIFLLPDFDDLGMQHHVVKQEPAAIMLPDHPQPSTSSWQQQSEAAAYQEFFDSAAVFKPEPLDVDLDALMGMDDDLGMQHHVVKQESNFDLEPPPAMELEEAASFPMEEFAPDEEDVENQLMHIDDQLIRLDGNIDDISEHLDEQFIQGGGAEALLTSDEEDFLFHSLLPRNTSFSSPFDDWQMDANRDLNELIASPSTPPQVEQQQQQVVVKEEPVVESEKPKSSVIKQEEDIKDESLDSEEEEFLELYPSMPSLVEDDDDDDMSSHHLVNHSYAMSAYDECFGDQETKKVQMDLEFSTYGAGASARSVASPGASSGYSSTAPHRESRDERKARQLGVPIPVSDIIELPMEEFNDLLTQHNLNDDQLRLCRDIRRRGKNKVAAQNCRRRKMDLISQLEDEVTTARHQKQVLLAEREELYRLRSEWSDKLRNLEEAVLRGLNKNVDEYSLELTHGSQGIRVAARQHTQQRLAKPAKA